MFKIAERRDLNENVVLMKIEAPLIARKAKAGQFIIFRTDEFGERIPLTVADTDPEKGTVTIIFQKAGEGTRLLATKKSRRMYSRFCRSVGTPF